MPYVRDGEARQDAAEAAVSTLRAWHKALAEGLASRATIQSDPAEATGLLLEASDHKLTSRPCGYDDCVWIQASETTALQPLPHA